MSERKGAHRRPVLRGFLYAAACAAGLALASTAPANAASLTLSGGTAGSIPGGASNELITTGLLPGPLVGGYYGSQITFDAPASSNLTIEFFGAEAGYKNSFYYEGLQKFVHPGGQIISPNLASPLASFSTLLSGSGLLDFYFAYNNGAGSVVNGANLDDATGTVGPNFFASCDPSSGAVGSGGTDCSSVYLFLDDGGAGPDDNHDDFLVRISVSSDVPAVPEPGTVTLLGLGLLGAAFAGRRVRSSRR